MEIRHEQPGAKPPAGRAPAAPPPAGIEPEYAGRVEREPTTTTTARRSDQRSVPQLLRQLTDQVMTLFTKEMALARSEVREAVSDAKVGVGSMASGGAVLFGGFLVLLFAAVAALALVMSVWLAALIVGVVTAIIGYVMLNAGKKKLQPSSFRPDRTMEQLRRDRAMAQSELRHGGSQ